MEKELDLGQGVSVRATGDGRFVLKYTDKLGEAEDHVLRVLTFTQIFRLAAFVQEQVKQE